MRSEPLCIGKWMCGISLGSRANASTRSRRKPIGCGEVKRSRSSPSMPWTASSSCTKGLRPSADFGKFVPPVQIDDLPEQRDLLDPARHERADFRHDLGHARANAPPRACRARCKTRNACCTPA